MTTDEVLALAADIDRAVGADDIATARLAYSRFVRATDDFAMVKLFNDEYRRLERIRLERQLQEDVK